MITYHFIYQTDKKSILFHYLFTAIIVFFLFGKISHGQNLLDSRKTSYYTYIYKLTDKEAKKICKRSIWKVDTTFFHTLIDSVPTDSQSLIHLPAGHYLKTYSEKNQQKIFVTTVPDFDVHLLNNNTDLCIRVYDLHGKILPDAIVKVKGKKLKFDNISQSFIEKKSNKKGLVKVTYNGFTGYYDLNRDLNNSAIRRSTRKVLYGTPLKYVWVPVNFAIRLPIDAVNSIVGWYPRGVIYRTEMFFVNSFERIACLFDWYYCDDNRFQNKHSGYMVLNKPKYLPGDTVKVKAFLVSKNGSPVNKPAKLILVNNRKYLEIATIEPYHPGGFTCQFYLHDSLDLKLDRDYTLYLTDKRRRNYIKKSFRYEEYELKKTNLNLRLSAEDQYKNKPFRVFISGTDENDLNLLDARIELFARPTGIDQYFNDHVFIPDTLFFFERKLDPSGETEVFIPDSIFPQANLKYKLQVRLLTSDNDILSEERGVNFYYLKREINFSLQEDSLKLAYLRNGTPGVKEIHVFAVDNFNNESEIKNDVTPCSIKLNPAYAAYKVISDSLESVFEISDEPSLLKCLTKRTKDSIYLMVDNPRKLPFTYTIYKQNSEKSRGYTDSLSIREMVRGSKNYFFSVRYLWGGSMQNDNYRIPYLDKKLYIQVIQPRIVYPGQKTRIEIRVTDPEGKPVPGVDLTAYSLTKKFEYSAPDLPYFGKNRKNKVIINNFRFNDFYLGAHPGLHLDYDAWKLLAGIDSIEYYKFIYPGNDLYRFEYTPEDGITQFSPFVTHDGAIIPIHVIYVDSKPVYFSWTTNTRPYAFKINPGYHQIKLRTAHQNITIDSVFFAGGQKLIFSLKDDLEHKHVQISEARSQLSSYEKQLLYRYILPYRNNFGEKYAYIENNGGIQFLKPSGYRYNYYNLAGPVTGEVEFNLHDTYSFNFFHEPGFEYDFSPQLLKMRSIDKSRMYPGYLNLYGGEQKLDDQVMTKKKLEDKWQEYLNSQRKEIENPCLPKKTSEGYGSLQIDYPKTGAETFIPLNVLIFRHDHHEFLRVYPGNTKIFHALKEGYYRLMFFKQGFNYCFEDSVYVNINGLTYHQINCTENLKSDSLGNYINSLIEDDISNKRRCYSNSWQISRFYKNTFTKEVSGYVRDGGSGKALHGVSILVPGTGYSAVTDSDGYYTILLPEYMDELQFYSSGYHTRSVNLGSDSHDNIELMPKSGSSNMVEGYIYDVVEGELLPGVNVMVKGTSIGTVTNMDGYYRIEVPEGEDTLQFSFIGYMQEEIPVLGRSNVNAYLIQDLVALDEVVVVGYGVMKKSDLMASVVRIDESSLAAINGIDSELAGLLQGQVAGVEISSNNDVPGSAVTITIRGASSTSFERNPLFVINGEVYTGDITDLDPDIIKNIEILKDASATAIYGAMGANGVVLINTKNGTFQPTGNMGNKGADYDQTFFDAAFNSSSIRDNFSDCAFWQPTLITDEQGKAVFETTFPDDITSWNTYYLAMNDNKQSGQTESTIKSYKPLMAQLSVPRFLIHTDTAYAIGKVLNYSPDSIAVTTRFEQDDKIVLENRTVCINSHLDTLPVIASVDSIHAKYTVETDAGYFDGELRKIPVYPVGLEETEGGFYVLDRDTTIDLSFDTTLGKVSLFARADILEVIEDEISRLIQYKYWCNEQIASKLKALLAEKKIAEYMGNKFNGDRKVEKLIRLLEKNQNDNGLWGWWNRSETSYWISIHVLETIIQARQEGYTVNFDDSRIAETMIWSYENIRDVSKRIRILKALKRLNAQIDYAHLISKLDTTSSWSIYKQLQLIELKQLCNLDYELDSLFSYKRTTLFGNTYFADEGDHIFLLENDVQTTILAYQILRNDTTIMPAMLGKIRNYFMEKRHDGSWRNTYESARIIETILPDLLAGEQEIEKPGLYLSGDRDSLITEFPFELTVSPEEKIQVTKSGDFPVYFTSYQSYWNSNPTVNQNDFIVTSRFENREDLQLHAGKETKLLVKVDVLKDAEYVMINIPIPGGCSYGEKKNNFANEVHREYFKNEVSIFSEFLGKGEYTFEVLLIPRYMGTYTLNPARVELMYFPTFNANNAIKKVIIE